ncbi:MAG: zf-TFIIB domain-containing protein [Phycisphaeraceae bacterium]|nr:zf-TFIIB domain-containing protein [Phycisphaeraceae bacterium]
MKCPRCVHVFLESHRVIRNVEGRQIEIDFCSRCGGIWFDRLEFPMLISVACANLAVPDGASDSGAPCPRCDGKLAEFYYPETFVKVDLCRECEGMWLDRDELREIYLVRRHRRDHGSDGPGIDFNEALSVLIESIEREGL